jgi:Fe-S-cluster-containing dehydrogenase component
MKRLSVVDAERCVGCQCCMFACSRRVNSPGLAESCIGVRSNGGMERGFVVVVCRVCEDPPCVRACPTDALVRTEKSGIKLYEEKCIGCGSCAEACIVGAVFWDGEINKPMICIHCGYCVSFCPHGVLDLKERGRRDHDQ